MSATLALLAPVPGEARIICRDGLQKVAGDWISTPYCQDNRLAQVARLYGARVSDREVRQNPNQKIRLCAWIGHDLRVVDACRGVVPGRRGRGY